MSRAVTGHAASIGIAGAASFACADLLDGLFGWRIAFAIVAGTAALAWLLVAWRVPAQVRSGAPAKPADGASLYDFRPVLANRSAMAYALAYCVHTLEMNAIRGWGVAFLGYVALAAGGAPAALAPTTVLTLLALAGTVASVAGNEASIRIGRRRLVTLAMAGSALVAGSIGWLGTGSYLIAVGLVFLWGMVAWLDSSSLTAGTAGTADPARRGATLAIHSMLGYAGGFVGPLMVGFVLDLSGGMSAAGWSAAFASIAVLMLAALLAFSLMRPNEVAGDGGADASAPAPRR